MGLIGAIASNTEFALLGIPIIFVPQVLFSGAFVDLDTIPEWIRWAQWLCTLKYGVNLAASTVLTSAPGGAYRPEFQQIFAQQNVDPTKMTRDAVVLCSLWVVFETLACILLVA